MKIFEITEYIDGGPNDRGYIVGYLKTDKTLSELRSERKHGFIDYNEISEELFNSRKEIAINELKKFDI